MKDERISRYYFLIIGNTGLLLIALAGIRYSTIIGDKQGYLLTFLGFILLISYTNFLEKKAEINKKVRIIVKVIFMVIFFVLSVYLYL